jgi:single-strand DNA-binding protein
MLKALILGHLGQDALVNNVNGKTVINFSVAHSENWVDNSGVKNQKTTWVSCSYWSEKTAIAQYLKKGVQVFVEGNMDAKIYKPTNGGETQAQLMCRVAQIQLLGGNKETQQPNDTASLRKSGHYSEQPVNSDIPQEDSSGLPF